MKFVRNLSGMILLVAVSLIGVFLLAAISFALLCGLLPDISDGWFVTFLLWIPCNAVVIVTIVAIAGLINYLSDALIQRNKQVLRLELYVNTVPAVVAEKVNDQERLRNNTLKGLGHA